MPTTQSFDETTLLFRVVGSGQHYCTTWFALDIIEMIARRTASIEQNHSSRLCSKTLSAGGKGARILEDVLLVPLEVV